MATHPPPVPTAARRVSASRWRRSLTAVATVVAVVAAACGDDAGDAAGRDVDVEVLPFELVQATEMTFEADPSDPTRTIFRVETTEPMICAIVWGEDESFGRMNNSLMMEGTGIIEHEVLLPDVEPGREYRFVVQGSTADGGLYASEVGTFTIDPGEVAVPGDGPGEDPHLGPNLAVGAEVVDVSSEFSGGFAASNAVDGNPATKWSSAGDGDDAYLVIDLGEPTPIGALAFVTRTMADGSAVTLTYTVRVDGGAPLGPFPAGTADDRRVSEVDLVGQVLRFDVATSTGGNTGAREVRVHAP